RNLGGVSQKFARRARTKRERWAFGMAAATQAGSRRWRGGGTYMDAALLMFAALAIGASAASPLGGLLSMWVAPTSFVLSLAVGFAAGVLLGALSFEMVPKALELGGLPVAATGLPIGVVLVWCFDLYINRGMTAGSKAEEEGEVRRFHRRHKPRGSNV